MKMTFRWYGMTDPVSLPYIKQIPVVTGIVSALYDIEVGDVWPLDAIRAVKNQIEKEGFTFEVVESVPVHEDIKRKKGNYLTCLNNYKQTLRHLAQEGIKCVCYNFMPIFDWLRTDANKALQDGSFTLAYDAKKIHAMCPSSQSLSLPGWNPSYASDEIQSLIDDYKVLGEEGLWQNLAYFVSEILPVAVECDLLMAIHPDDPPWSLFGIPRIMTSTENIHRFLSLYPHRNHGLTFCTGSLGCKKENDVVSMIDTFASMDRIHFVHLRNVLLYEDGSFDETAHPSLCGSLDMANIIKTLTKHQYQGYLRPDHGRMIFGETGKPGYGLYDRALGAMYLYGLIEANKKNIVTAL